MLYGLLIRSASDPYSGPTLSKGGDVLQVGPLLRGGGLSEYFSHLVQAKRRRLRQDPLEAILVIFGRRALIFCLKALGKKGKMMPLWCACAVVITLETQKCRKRAPRSVKSNFFINCDRHKRFSQNERRRIDLQDLASDFLIFALGQLCIETLCKRASWPTFLSNFVMKFYRRCLSTSSIPWCKKVENDQKLKSKGTPLIWVFGHFWLFCTMV